MITPKMIAVQKDDNDHDGPDKAVVFARFPVDFKNGEWHKVRLSHVSAGRTFFVFTRGGKHKRTISMTQRMLARLCETDGLTDDQIEILGQLVRGARAFVTNGVARPRLPGRGTAPRTLSRECRRGRSLRTCRNSAPGADRPADRCRKR